MFDNKIKPSFQTIPKTWNREGSHWNSLLVLQNGKIIHYDNILPPLLEIDNQSLLGQTLEYFLDTLGVHDGFPLDQLVSCDNIIEIDVTNKSNKYRISFDSHASVVDNNELLIIIINLERMSSELEHRLNYYLEFEKLVSSISQDFINCRYDKIDEFIDLALGEVGIISGVDRVYLFKIDDNGSTMTNTHEWVNDGIIPYKDELQEISRTNFAWLDEQLANNEVIVVNDTNEIPEEAQKVREEFKREGIQSIVLVPLIYGGEYLGFVGYDQVRYKRNWDNAIVSILSVIGEIITHSLQRFKIEHALRENEQKYRLLFENSLDGIYITTFKGKIVDANQAFFEIFGINREKMEDIRVEELYANPSDRKELLAKLYEKKRIRNEELTLKREDGTLVYCLASIEMVEEEEGDQRMYGVLKNITNFKKAQLALIESEKLNSLAILAGGIAHDFNNILTSILGHSSLISSMNPKEEISELNSKLMLSAEKASELVNKLLAYSGQKTIITEILNLKDEIKKSREFLDITIPSAKNIQYDLKETGNVELDQIQFNQILVNIVTNAVEATEDDAIVIRSGRLDGDEIKPEEYDLFIGKEIEAVSYCFVSVKDKGLGIDDTVLAKIFEPFFSTKKGGSGLGLSATVGIVKSHKGAIGIKSEVNHGTEFVVFFPSSQEEIEVQSEIQKTINMTVSGQKRILIVDDDPEIISVLELMLNRLNIESSSVNSGYSAIEQFQMDPSFDLIIIDQSMPGLNGLETMRDLRQKGYRVPIILSSGYSEEIIKLDQVHDSDVKFLQKPYNLEELKEMISAILNSNPENF